MSMRTVGAMGRWTMASRNTPVVINGVEYSSQAQAASVLGISPNAVHYRISSPKYLNFYKKGAVKSPAVPNTPIGRPGSPVTINGVEYASQTQAASALGIRTYQLRKRLSSPHFPNYQWKTEARHDER